jgi:uncharacterized protein (TIGR03083 family)
MADSTALAPERYFALIDADTERMLEVAARGLSQPVPSCPGWTVADVVTHTSYVYVHKVRVMADGGWPDAWPPATYDDLEPIEFLRQAKDELFEEFARHDPSEQTATFGADSTIMFWARRMALEIAVHRYDVELAHDEVTEVADDVALDGIDELLKVFLAGDYLDPDDPTEHPVNAAIAISAGGHQWVADVRDKHIAVTDGPGDVAATVSGSPSDVFLWMWGRRHDAAVDLGGDGEVIGEFRARLVECQG